MKVTLANGDVMEPRVCLLPMVSDLSRMLLKLSTHYHNGLLFKSGGLMDQPNIYLEAMEYLPRGIFSSS